MTTSDRTGRGARAEARPHTWEELTEEQQNAARQACRILGEIAAAANERDERKRDQAEERKNQRRGPWRFLPPIDEARLNHVILLDGGRGSGKTALLISLLQGWSERLRQLDRATRRNDRDAANEAKEMPPDLIEMTRQVVPVGLIDLQPLPRSTHLLLHIVGQFLPLVEAIEDDERPVSQRERAPWHDVQDEEPKATTAWKKFLRAAAMGWDGSIAERRARLDPEAYALEVEHAERQQLDVRASFRELVDNLAEETPRLLKTKDRPLFVIPIDDADMNPERAVELLDLVRTLWHPRVAFLLTGESELFQTVLRAHVLATLRSPLRWRASLTRDELTAVSKMQPTDLADNIYEKAVPWPHRCKIPPLTMRSRFEFLARGQVLRNLDSISHPLRLAHLEEYLQLQKQAQGILPGRLRRLEDLASRVRMELSAQEEKVSHKSGGTSQQDEAAKIQATRERRAARRRVTREILEELCQRKIPGLSYQDDEEDEIPRPQNGLKLGQDTLWHCEAIALVSNSIDSHRAVCLASRPRFVKRVRTEQNRVVSTELDACQLISFDAHQWPLLAPSGNGLQKFSVWVDFHSNLSDRPLSFAWPLPDWTTPLDYAGFLEYWQHIIISKKRGLWIPQPEEDIGYTARLFLMTVITYEDFTHTRKRPSPNAELEPILPDLHKLADSLAATAPTWEMLAATIRERAGDLSRTFATPQAWWARCRAGLLAAPESGLPLDEANSWLSALKREFGKDWERACGEMYQERAHRARATLLAHTEVDKDVLRALLQELDSIGPNEPHGPSYLWRTEILPGKQTFWHTFIDGVNKINVLTRCIGPISFLSYLECGRAEALEKQVAAELLQRWLNDIKKAREVGGRLAAPVLAKDLWLNAAELGKAPRIAVLEERPSFQTLTDFYETELKDPWKVVQAGTVVPVGPGLLVAPVVSVWREDLWTETPLAKPLFELVWDVVADVDDEPFSDEPEASISWWEGSRWEGAGGRRAGGKADRKIYPWPFVDWPAFIDTALFIEAWNKIIPKAAEAHRDMAGDETVVNDLAYWYIDAIWMLARNRQMTLNWKIGVELRDLIDAFERAHNGDNGNAVRKGRRYQRYAAWGRALPLLAAPESGLSRAAAEAILEVVQIDDAYRQTLRSLRSTRLFHRKRPNRPVKPELDAIDEANPDHPWVVKIERGA